jgi:hypothetical protein
MVIVPQAGMLASAALSTVVRCGLLFQRRFEEATTGPSFKGSATSSDESY